MTFFSKLKKTLFETNNSSDEENLSVETFADNFILEIRRAVHEEIVLELKKNEGRFLSKILKNSYFPIESISLIPFDHEVALKANEFFRAHSELNTDFEKDFLVNNLPIEYRSSKGARALITKNTLLTIKPSRLGTDIPTQDESYQITIRGKKKLFTAEISIGSIIDDSKKSALSSTATSQSLNQVIPQLNEVFSGDLRKKISITIEDKNGKSELNLELPLIIGRSNPEENYGEYQKINIESTYISRNQFVIIDILGTIYGFIPSEAKLTAVSGRRGTLRPLSLIKIDSQGLFLTFGQPLDVASIVVDHQRPELYASVKIKPYDLKPQTSLTPVPNVIKS